MVEIFCINIYLPVQRENAPEPPLAVEENAHFVDIAKLALKPRKADPGK